MLIETNVEVNLRSIEEFTRVMVSELLEDKINFEILKENYKEWKKYLDNEKIKLALIKNPRINNIMLKYFEEFGLEKAIKLGLKNPKVVMSMINNADIYDMKIWYEKTGETFIPNRIVMKEFPKKDIDKFLLSGKSWSILMRLESYSTSPEKIKSLIKASYLFGVFDQDKTGFDNLYHILTNIPKKISIDYENVLEEVKKSINNENRKLLEDSLKEENIDIKNTKNQYMDKNDEKNHIFGTIEAYIDGSYEHASKTYGSGVVILQDGKILDTISNTGKNPNYVSMRNVAGEIEASILAMKYCIDRGYRDLLIYYDYEGIEKWCTGEWKANKEGTIYYRQFCIEAMKKTNISFKKVKAHSGDKYNDMADKLAKQAVFI